MADRVECPGAAVGQPAGGYSGAAASFAGCRAVDAACTHGLQRRGGDLCGGWWGGWGLVGGPKILKSQYIVVL